MIVRTKTTRRTGHGMNTWTAAREEIQSVTYCTCKNDDFILFHHRFPFKVQSTKKKQKIKETNIG